MRGSEILKIQAQKAKGHVELALIAGGVALGILIAAQTIQASLAGI